MGVRDELVRINRLQINSILIIRALEKVSFGADGQIDPSTVGPEVRATARAYIGAHLDDGATR